MTSTASHDALKIIHQRATNFTPKIAIILGSGSGALAEHIEKTVVIPYQDLPGFHTTTVAGHKGNLYLGKIKGVPVACLQGRPHYYEDVSNDVIKTMIRTLKLMGCETLLATNASGSIRKEIPAGSLVLINDHINFQFNSVLVGENDESFGPRFISLQDLYDRQLRKQILNAAKKLKIKMKEGIYIGVIGPSYETPAEINAFRIWGADVVGMSTIPEVIVAHHCGMRVAAISVVTNMAAGLANTEITHEETLHNAQMAADRLVPLVINFVAEYH
jgi:xanthosine phosphorylase